ncbi:MAG: DUF2961 domain-containing protein [Limisphaerales bacterium]
MRRIILKLKQALAGALLLSVYFGSEAAEAPVLPVGLDAYRMWDHWADQRIGQRTYMRSTYDRSGGNLNADASNFLFQLADDRNVTLDIEGRGVVVFVRYNHWHGSPWHYQVDGVDHILRESMTADPSAQLRLSSPIQAWDGKAGPGQDVVDLINRSGQDLVPAIGSPAAEAMKLTGERGSISIPKDASVTLTTLSGGPSMLRAIDFSVPEAEAVAFGRASLRITWDDRRQPSVDAPVALFFGAGTLHNRTGAEYLVKAFPVHIRSTGGRVALACYFPMPFFKSARIELAGNGDAPLTNVQWMVRRAPYSGTRQQCGLFPRHLSRSRNSRAG